MQHVAPPSYTARPDYSETRASLSKITAKSEQDLSKIMEKSQQLQQNHSKFRAQDHSDPSKTITAKSERRITGRSEHQNHSKNHEYSKVRALKSPQNHLKIAANHTQKIDARSDKESNLSLVLRPVVYWATLLDRSKGN